MTLLDKIGLGLLLTSNDFYQEFMLQTIGPLARAMIDRGWRRDCFQIVPPASLPVRARTENTAALLPWAPTVHRIPTVVRKAGKLHLDIEARDMIPGRVYTFNLKG